VARRRQCGWLRDRYGLSWQIVPAGLGDMMRDPDRGRAGRVMKALLGMRKIDLAALRRARDEA
jgi:predicted 3-demethylubiquinone-9 3-methyltransferase (glyoxalase superfamily)